MDRAFVEWVMGVGRAAIVQITFDITQDQFVISRHWIEWQWEILHQLLKILPIVDAPARDKVAGVN